MKISAHTAKYYHASVRNQVPLRRQSGFSMVELMVAMLISLFLLSGVIQIFLGSKQSYNVNEGLSRLQENARYAFDRINEDLSAGGYTGCNDSGDATQDGGLKLRNTLTINTSTAYNFSDPLEGTDDTGLNNSDTLSIRRAVTATSVPLTAPLLDPNGPISVDATHPNYDSLKQWQIMALSDCNATAIFMITNDPETSGGTILHAPNIVSPSGQPNEGQSNRASTDPDGITGNYLGYQFGSESASVAQTTQIATTTYSIEDDASIPVLAINGTPLVEGVRNMQVLYGIDSDGTAGVERYVEADDAALVDMNEVVSVRVSLDLVALNANGVPVQIDNTDLGKTFTQTFRVRNR